MSHFRKGLPFSCCISKTQEDTPICFKPQACYKCGYDAPVWGVWELAVTLFPEEADCAWTYRTWESFEWLCVHMRCIDMELTGKLNKVYVRDVSCADPIEKLYYTAKYSPICVYCAISRTGPQSWPIHSVNHVYIPISQKIMFDEFFFKYS